MASEVAYLNGEKLLPSIARLLWNCDDLRSYLANNVDSLIDYGARYRSKLPAQEAWPRLSANCVELPLMNDVNRPLSVRKPTASTKPAIAMKSVASAQWRTAAELNLSSPGAALRAGSQLGPLPSLSPFPLFDGV